MMMCRSKTAAVVFLLVLFSGTLFADEWYVSYENGRDALRQQKWQAAINYFNDAISSKEESEAKAKTTGLRFIDYFPYLYRGLAYEALRNTTKALEDLQKEERYGEVNRAFNDTDAKRRLEEGLDRLRKGGTFARGRDLFNQREYAKAIEEFKLIDQNSTQYADAQNYIRLAEAEVKKSVTPATETKIEKNTKKEIIADELTAGVQLFNQNDLDGAEGKFRSVLRSTPNSFVARRYLRRIMVLRQNQVKRPPMAEKQPARQENPTATTSSVHDKQENPTATTSSVHDKQENLFREGLGFYAAGKLKAARARFQTLHDATPSYAGAAAYLDTIAQAEEGARKGISSFLEGEYRQSIEQLGEVVKKEADNAALHAFLGCAYAAQYLLTGAEDRALQQNATEAFRKAKQLDPNYKLDGHYISPRIIAMY